MRVNVGTSDRAHLSFTLQNTSHICFHCKRIISSLSVFSSHFSLLKQREEEKKIKNLWICVFAFAGFARSLSHVLMVSILFRCCFHLSDLLQFAHFTIMKLEPWFSAFFCSRITLCVRVRVCDDKIITNKTLSLHSNWFVECDVVGDGSLISHGQNSKVKYLAWVCARSSNKHYVSNVDDYLTRYRKVVFFLVLFLQRFFRFTLHSLNGVLCLQQHHFKYDQWNVDWSSVLISLLKWWIWNINDNKTCTLTASN